MKTFRGNLLLIFACALAGVIACTGAHAPAGSGGEPDGGNEVGGSDGGSEVEDIGLPTGPALVGWVSALNGTPLSNVTVQLSNGMTATTGEDGWFAFERVPSNVRLILRVEHPGYSEAILPVSVADDGDAFANVVLFPARGRRTIDAATGGTVDDGAGARATFPAGVLVTRAGQPVSGSVDLSIAPFDVTDSAQLAVLPGELIGRRHDGSSRALEGLVPMAVTARQGNQLLTLASGRSVNLTLPIPSSLAASAPGAVSLWSLNTESGSWIEEGTAVKQADAASPSGFVYAGAISHLSLWNGTQWVPSRCLTGHVIGLDNHAAPWARISVITRPPSATYNGIANNDGLYFVVVPSNAEITLTAITYDSSASTPPLNLHTASGDNPRSSLFEGCDGVQTIYMQQQQVPPPPAGGNAIALPVLPVSAWTRNGGQINPLCAPPNPTELSFSSVLGTSVVLQSAALGVNCCSCTARTRSYRLPTRRAATARLRGVFAARRDAAAYSVGSMRVELFRNGSRLGTRIYAAENRPNNNCAGSSERPETLLRSGAAFNVPLAPLAPAGATFDEIRIHLQGYGCGPSNQSVGVSQLAVVGG